MSAVWHGPPRGRLWTVFASIRAGDRERPARPAAKGIRWPPRPAGARLLCSAAARPAAGRFAATGDTGSMRHTRQAARSAETLWFGEIRSRVG
jgi:hypothetical protein